MLWITSDNAIFGPKIYIICIEETFPIQLLKICGQMTVCNFVITVISTVSDIIISIWCACEKFIPITFRFWSKKIFLGGQ